MIVETFACNECKVLRREANHWFRAAKLSSGVFTIAPWDNGPLMLADGDKEQHLCSEKCASVAMSKAIGAGK